MSWSVKLQEQRQLKTQGAKLLYQRIRLLREIKDDEGFIAHCDEHAMTVLEYLDEELADVGYGWQVLLTVFEHFPKESDWAKKLSHLIATVLENQKTEREPRTTKSWKDVAKDYEKEIERLRAELNVAAARVSELEKVIRLMAHGDVPELAKA